MSMILHVIAVTPDQIATLGADPETLDEVMGADPARQVSLEKAWHGLHYLLTGNASGGTGPEAFLLAGGEPIGEDLGYGPARLMGPDAVQALARTLSAISDEQLWRRFDADRMTEEGIYPLIWDEGETELREEYLGYYHALQEVVATASMANNGLVLVLS
jgi:hypothetical protein